MCIRDRYKLLETEDNGAALIAYICKAGHCSIEKYYIDINKIKDPLVLLSGFRETRESTSVVSPLAFVAKSSSYSRDLGLLVD